MNPQERVTEEGVSKRLPKLKLRWMLPVFIVAIAPFIIGAVKAIWG